MKQEYKSDCVCGHHRSQHAGLPERNGYCRAFVRSELEYCGCKDFRPIPQDKTARKTAEEIKAEISTRFGRALERLGDDSKPSPEPSGWEERMADLIDKEAVECGGISHEPDCQAMAIINLAKEVERVAEERMERESDELSKKCAELEKQVHIAHNQARAEAIREAIEKIENMKPYGDYQYIFKDSVLSALQSVLPDTNEPKEA